MRSTAKDIRRAITGHNKRTHIKMPTRMSGLQAAVSKYGLRPAKSGKEKSEITKAQRNQMKNDKARRRRFDAKVKKNLFNPDNFAKKKKKKKN